MYFYKHTFSFATEVCGASSDNIEKVETKVVLGCQEYKRGSWMDENEGRCVVVLYCSGKSKLGKCLSKPFPDPQQQEWLLSTN